MKHLTFILLVLTGLTWASHAGYAQSASIELIKNPLLKKGADPWITQHRGRFYYCYSKGDRIAVKVVDKIAELPSAPERIVWTAPSGTHYSKNIWAPELHFIQGRWYIYFAADDGHNANHRMHIVATPSTNIDDAFQYLGKISDKSDKWAIDGTVLVFNQQLYFVWSGWEGDTNVQQNLYIAQMDNPTTVSSARRRISAPTHEWEKRGAVNGLPTINEGPQVIQDSGKVFIVYSASGSWSDYYCLGLLELTGDNPLLPNAWIKHEQPVFEGTDCVISPGHPSFLKIGTQDYIVYHHTRIKGGGWQNRQVKIQPFYWQNFKPVFGTPLQDGSLVKIVYPPH